MFAAGKSARVSGGGSSSGDTHFDKVTLLLDGEGTNGGQNNQFIDSLGNTITRIGNITQGSFSPFRPSSDAYSVSVNSGSSFATGTGNYLTTSGGATYTGDYTIEGWFFQTGFGSSPYTNIFAGGSTQIFIEGDGTGGKRFGSVGIYNGSSVVSAANVVPKWQWNHIAWQRSGSTTTIYVNGISVATSSSISGTINASTIGAYSGGSYQFQGYMSNIRMSGIARYSGNFTPPTTPFSIDGATSLLLKLEHANIIDKAMMNNVVTFGNAQISTSVKKYGTSSLYNPADLSGGGLRVVNGGGGVGTIQGDFTIEWWAYHNNLNTGSNHVMLGPWGGVTGSQLLVRVDNGTDYQIYLANAAGLNVSLASSGIVATTWQHYAITRSGSTCYAFVGGTLIGSWTNSSTLDLSIVSLMSENAGTSTIPDQMLGYMEGIRITNGIARYTSTFTPPSEFSYVNPKPPTTVNYLIVAGGGGGGGGVGGGGGAGGVLSGNTALSSGTTYSITVGSGGAGVSDYGPGADGGNSTFNGLTAIGGGGGGGYSPATVGRPGGSGGGANGYSSGRTGGAGTAGQGNNGGDGAGSSQGYAGGGGGASQKGGNAYYSGTDNANSYGGAGGHGKFSYITGTPAYYGGGGGAASGVGSVDTGLPAFGGAGGGGQGGSDTPPGTFGFNAVASTGGGGGGSRDYPPAGNGGSGVVILSIPTSQYTGTYTGGPTVTTVGTNTVLKFTNASGSYTA